MTGSAAETSGDKPIACSGCDRAITIRPPDVKGEVKCPECARLLWSVHPQRDVTVVNCTEYTLDNRQDILLAEQLFHAGHRRLLLNFGEVWRIGSESLGLLIRLNKNLESAQGRLALCNIRREIDQVLRITRLKRLLNIHGDLAAAINSF